MKQKNNKNGSVLHCIDDIRLCQDHNHVRISQNSMYMIIIQPKITKKLSLQMANTHATSEW